MRSRSNAIIHTEATAQDIAARQRLRSMFDDIEHQVRNNNALAQVWHSFRTFRRTDLSIGKVGEVAFNVSTSAGKSLVVGVAVAPLAATGPFGLAAIATAAAIGVTFWGIGKLLNLEHHQTKLETKQTIKTIADLTIQNNSDFRFNECSEIHTIASSVLNSMIYDMDVYLKLLSETGNLPVWDEVAKMPHPTIWQLAKENIDSSMAWVVGRDTSQEAMRQRAARLWCYRTWMRTYVAMLRENLEKRSRELESHRGGNINAQLEAQVGLLGNHGSCQKCYGPQQSQIRILQGHRAPSYDKVVTPQRKLVNANEANSVAEAARERSNDIASHALSGQLATAANSALNNASSTAASWSPFSHFQQVVIAGTAKNTKRRRAGAMIQAGGSSAGTLVAKPAKDLASNSIGAVSGAAAAAAAAAGVVGAIGGAIGAIASEAAGRLKNSVVINRPILKAVHARLGVNATMETMDDDVRQLLDNGKVEVLTRVLTKVAHHYPKLISEKVTAVSEQLKRLDSASPTQEAPSRFQSCDDMAMFIRRTSKVDRYIEKLNIHLALLEAGIDGFYKVFAKSDDLRFPEHSEMGFDLTDNTDVPWAEIVKKSS